MSFNPEKLTKLKDNHGRKIEYYFDNEEKVSWKAEKENEVIYFIHEHSNGEYNYVDHFNIVHFVDGRETLRVPLTKSIGIKWE